MSGYMASSREEDPVHTVRTIGRISQMLIELRDEYVKRPRTDTLLQIQQRLDDLIALREALLERIAHAKAVEDAAK